MQSRHDRDAFFPHTGVWKLVITIDYINCTRKQQWAEIRDTEFSSIIRSVFKLEMNP